MTDREAFEQWAKDKVCIERCSCGQYINVMAREMWPAWQAATAAERERAAMVVEWFPLMVDDNPDDVHVTSSHRHQPTRKEIADAIRQG